MFFLQNMITTALSYFLPIILQSGMGFGTGGAIISSQPPYHWAVVPVILTSLIADRYQLRGPIVVFNSVCIIIGLVLLGFVDQIAVRYVGTYFVTGGYVVSISNSQTTFTGVKVHRQCDSSLIGLR